MLEATVIILDNTEYMRNGDYHPTRLEAQKDAAQLLIQTKLRSNVENAVAIMTMGGPSPRVMVTLTSENGKLMHALNSVPIEGSSASLKSAIQVAQLTLKHRQNTNQHQRIVVFTGSPLTVGEEEGLALHKILRKNGIALDVVSFGAAMENDNVLEALLYGGTPMERAMAEESEHANHLVRVFQGQGISVMEAIRTSGIIRANATAGAGSGTTGEFDFGVDEDMDPELAMALKASMEDEMARQAAVAAAANKDAAEQEKSTAAADEDNGMDIDQEQADEDEDALLQQAIALSMQQHQPDSQ